MELKDYIRIVKKYVWISLLVGIAGGILAFMANKATGFIPLYQASATVMIGGDVATVEDNLDYRVLADQFSETYADLATRRPVLQAVIDALGLDMTTDDLSSQVSAEVVEGTQLIEITALDNNAKRAADVANETARQLIVYSPRAVRNFVLLVEDAEVPTNRSLTFMLLPIVAGVLFFLLTGGLAMIVEFLREPVFSMEELKRRTGLPVLATIRSRPRLRGWRQRRSERKLPAWRRALQEASWWPLMQNCRRHFDVLELLPNPHPKPPVVLVTSPTTTERRDKGLVAANLATTWARTGDRVLLVDADSAAPLPGKWFKGARQPGLADLLDGRLAINDIPTALRPTDVPGLSLLPIGNAQENTYEGLYSQTLERVMNELSHCADAIVVNAPPILAGGGSAILAHQAHGVLLTLKAGRTRMQAASDAQDVLQMAQDNLWGAILME
jgi:capsular polysaccharide biosynthesis protein/Mrp family chromosome partitioning ATPase